MTIEEAKDKAYQSMNNYKVVDYPNNKSNLCYIFCSSNGLCTGRAEEQEIEIVNNDR